MRVLLIVLCLLATLSPALAGRARWKGSITTDDEVGSVVISGKLSRDCRTLTGRWKCTGPGCVKKRGKLQMSCGASGGYVGSGSKRCSFIGTNCSEEGGTLRPRLTLDMTCAFAGEGSTVLLVQQPPAPSCGR